MILIAESALVEIKIQLKMPEKDKTADHPVGPDGKKLKPCCACPETKKVRDECIMEKVCRAGQDLAALNIIMLSLITGGGELWTPN